VEGEAGTLNLADRGIYLVDLLGAQRTNPGAWPRKSAAVQTLGSSKSAT